MKGNMIVFPGTVERLLERAEDALQEEDFGEAVRVCEQLLELAPELPELPGLLAVALYETKDFDKAKPYAAAWVQSDPADYFEAMELYLAVSIQLQDYEEVEEIISALLEENIIPPDLRQKFIYLKELNGRLTSRFAEDAEPPVREKVTMQSFLDMDPNRRQQLLAQLEKQASEEDWPLLIKVAQSDELPAILRTAALVILRNTGCTEQIAIVKFGRGLCIIPAELPAPGEDELTEAVCRLLRQNLDKDPTRLQLMEESVRKFALISYPVGWGATAEAVAEAYTNYSSYLFEGNPLPPTALQQLILSVDQDTGQAAE
ncbi:hypothetical protein NCCP2716_13150 [Sporosarcina sp. NCCP-2716]|nr:hypothetical protein NCCP2716_13150 [Sporosarcina sp. NCCP-2716]